MKKNNFRALNVNNILFGTAIQRAGAIITLSYNNVAVEILNNHERNT